MDGAISLLQGGESDSWGRIDWRAIPIAEAMATWLRLSTLDKKTMRIYRRGVAQFSRLGPVVMGDISRQAVAKFQDERLSAGKQPTTVNNYTKGITGLMKFVSRRTHMPALALREITDLFLKERRKDGPPDYYTREEFTGTLLPLAYRIAPWFGLAFEIACWTGARRTELRYEEREDYDLEKRVLRLTRQTKFGKMRTVSLCEPVITAIRKYAPPSGAMFPARNMAARTPYVSDDTFRQAMRKLGKLSGLKCTWHKCRRTFTTWALQADVPVEDVARELGHESLELIYRRYLAWIRGYNPKIERMNRLPPPAA